MYKYQFYLDCAKAPEVLNSNATNIYKLTDTLIVYEFSYPPIKGADIVQKAIDDIQELCVNYKLIVVGEDPGHIEIYKSEDYNGVFNVELTHPVVSNIKLWEDSKEG